MRPARTHLAAVDPDLADLISRIGRCGLVVEKCEPWEALVRAISHQQLHGTAARAIMARFVALYPEIAFPTPERVLATEPERLRGCGLSASKIATIQGIATATLEGLVPTRRAAARMPDEALVARLTTLRGVGRWTVEMLLMFCLGRPDVLPVDDFGVREGFRLLRGLEAQPKPRELAAATQAWAPYRSVAAWYLWRRADEGRKIQAQGKL